MLNEKYYQANKKVLQYESMVRHFDCQSTRTHRRTRNTFGRIESFV